MAETLRQKNAAVGFEGSKLVALARRAGGRSDRDYWKHWQQAQQNTKEIRFKHVTSAHRHWVSEARYGQRAQSTVDLEKNQPCLQTGRMRSSSIKWLAWGLTVSGSAGTRAKSDQIQHWRGSILTLMWGMGVGEVWRGHKFRFVLIRVQKRITAGKATTSDSREIGTDDLKGKAH